MARTTTSSSRTAARLSRAKGLVAVGMLSASCGVGSFCYADAAPSVSVGAIVNGLLAMAGLTLAGIGFGLALIGVVVFLYTKAMRRARELRPSP